MEVRNTSGLKCTRLVCLIYGASGAGKTYLASSFPSPFFLSTEEGLLGLRKKELPFVEIRSLKEWEEAYDVALERKEETVVVDSLTSWQDLLMEDILKNGHRQVPQIQDWGQVVAKTQKLIVDMKRDFPDKNLIFIATDEVDKDEVTGKLEGLPHLIGKSARRAPAFVDMLWFLEVKAERSPKTGLVETKRLLYTSSTLLYRAKDRTGCLPPVLENPSYEKIKEYL